MGIKASITNVTFVSSSIQSLNFPRVALERNRSYTVSRYKY